MDEKQYVSKEAFDAETKRVSNALDYTNKRIDDIKDFVSWGIGVLSITFVLVQIGIGFLLYVITKTPG